MWRRSGFEVVATLRQVAGDRGARLLRRTLDEETEFVSLTFFDDLHAVRRLRRRGLQNRQSG